MTNFLAEQGHDVVYYAFQNYPGQAITDRFIHPNIRFIDALLEDPESPKGFGDKAIKPSFEKENPDVLFLYNDLPVTSAIFKLLDTITCRVVVYLDIVYPWENIEMYDHVRSVCDDCFVFLQCWKDHLVDDLGWERDRVHVLKLGVDIDTTQIENAKSRLGFSEDDFIIFNLNRNSYRKQWCTSIQAFIEFLHMNNFDRRIKFMCGCLMVTEDGYDIRELVVIECRRRKLNASMVLTNHVFMNPNPVVASEDYIRTVYNATDVGINTCCGEGFGLTNAEHACFGKIQVVSGVPAFKEFLKDHAIIIEPAVWTQVSRFESHGGDVAYFNYKDFANAFDDIFKERVSRFVRRAEFPWDFSILAEVIGTDRVCHAKND
jgi:hypothetical protein